MQGGVLELARQAAAAASGERAAQESSRQRVRNYRGVTKRGDTYVAEIMDADGILPVFLGSYATPEEAAYAYDAAARSMHGALARPNFPEPAAPPAPGPGGGAAPAAAANATEVAPQGQGQGVFLFGANLQAPAVAVASAAAPGPALFSGLQRAPAPPAPALAAAHPRGRVYAAAFLNFLQRVPGPDPAAAGGSNGGAGFYRMHFRAPVVPAPAGGPMPNGAVNPALSGSDNDDEGVVIDPPEEERKPRSNKSGEPVVVDNFTGGDAGASTSAARPAAPVPPLKLKDLMDAEIPRGGAGDDGADGAL